MCCAVSKHAASWESDRVITQFVRREAEANFPASPSPKSASNMSLLTSGSDSHGFDCRSMLVKGLSGTRITQPGRPAGVLPLVPSMVVRPQRHRMVACVGTFQGQVLRVKAGALSSHIRELMRLCSEDFADISSTRCRGNTKIDS